MSRNEYIKGILMLRKIVVLLLIFAVGVGFSESIFVEYLEGYVEVNEESEWYEIYIGDELDEESVIRISEEGLVELSRGNKHITFSRDGTFRIMEIIQESEAADSWGILKLIGNKLETISKGSEDDDTAVMGVRGDEATEDFMWIGDDEELLTTGRELIDEEKYDEALSLLTEALELADEEEPFIYLIAFALAQLERPHEALALLIDVELDPLSTSYEEMVLLKGQLLMGQHALDDALEVFSTYLSDNIEGKNTQLIAFLAGYCYFSLGEISEMMEMLEFALEIDPNTLIAAHARELLANLPESDD